ncbi:MAG TPA: PilZ domain-containing protein [Nitrospira sp.]|nr:PilZ domain-containing protein [Nitrospira sp.]
MVQIESSRALTESVRSSERFPMTCPVIYGGAPFVGEGSLLNLSLTGCSVKTDRTVQEDSYIRLSMVMPGHTSSLSIELGKVRWVRNHAFGVEFIRLPRLSNQRLDRVSWERLIQSLPRRPEPQ